ncbi:MAG: hypothetical protein AAFQ50_17290 [Pseudomonadota bacterium]
MRDRDARRWFRQHGRYTAGVETRYAPGMLVGPDPWQPLAQGYPLGMRFHSAPVIRWADARRMDLGHAITADGRWRLMVFAGQDPAQAFDLLRSPARDPAHDTLLILQSGHRETVLDPTDPSVFPATGTLGLRNPETVFCPDPAQDIFDMRGIDRDAGALVLVRPDQYVAHVIPLDRQDILTDFLAQIRAG